MSILRALESRAWGGLAGLTRASGGLNLFDFRDFL